MIQAANSEPAAVKAEAGRIDARDARQKFTEVMDDDFNTPQALAVLFDLARDINRGTEQGAATAEARHALKELAGVMGFDFKGGGTVFYRCRAVH